MADVNGKTTAEITALVTTGTKAKVVVPAVTRDVSFANAMISFFPGDAATTPKGPRFRITEGEAVVEKRVVDSTAFSAAEQGQLKALLEKLYATEML